MSQHLRPALVLFSVFTFLVGLIYPLSITGIAQLAMPAAANGSLVTKGNAVVGSTLIGQNFTNERYFHSRPSATSAPDPADPAKTIDAPYNAAASGGSNLGPLSKKLVDRVKTDIGSLRKQGVTGPIPVDSVTTSGSGLDPDISPDNAYDQVVRVAKARGLSQDGVRNLVDSRIERRAFGVFGAPRVNVLALNLALDAIRP